MTIINNKVVLAPYNGGTVNSSLQSMSWCQMSPTRVVVVYHQSNPTGRRFTIIDNSTGLSSGDAPSITNGAYYDTLTFNTSGTVRVDRINGNTFAVVTTSTYAPSNLQYNIDVYTITGTSITKVYSTTLAQGQNRTSNQGVLYQYWTAFQQPMVTYNVADNTLDFAYSGGKLLTNPYYSFGTDSYQTLLVSRFTWNPTNNTGSFSTVTNSNYTIPSNYGGGIDGYVSFGPNNPFSPISLYVNQSRGGITVGFRVLSSSFPSNRSANIRSGAHFIQKAGVSMGNQFRIDPYYETGLMSSNRQTLADFKSAYYYDANGLANQGGTTFPITGTQDMTASMPFVLGLDDNYHAVIDSRYFVDPTKPYQMKIVRREDSNIVLPSPSSTGTYGFTVNVPQVTVFWDKPRPVVISTGDIMWGGVKLGTTEFNLVILKQPPLPN